MSKADELIALLDLQAHPEGGWYRETWRASADRGCRPASTAILFLLKSDERSHWHRVDADEIWLWQAGDSLKLQIADTAESQPTSELLGSPDLDGHRLQGIVRAGQWQAAEPQPGGRCGYVLVTCVVAPGFDFSGFELAPAGWQPGS